MVLKLKKNGTVRGRDSPVQDPRTDAKKNPISPGCQGGDYVILRKVKEPICPLLYMNSLVGFLEKMFEDVQEVSKMYRFFEIILNDSE